MKEKSEGLKKFAEQYYWNHMSRFHFITVMAQGFDQQIVIPQKFIKCFKEKLSEDVVLKGPSGNLWLVKLVKIQDDLLLKDGWKEFVEAHHIAEGDMLSFECEGYSCFNVLIYDTRSRCERETSYFARNHKNIMAETVALSKTQSVDNAAEHVQKSPPSESHEMHSPRQYPNDMPHVEQLSPQNFPASNGNTASASPGIDLADQSKLSIDTMDSPEKPLYPDNVELHSPRVHCDGNMDVDQLSSPKIPASSGKTAFKSLSVQWADQRKDREGEHSAHPMVSKEDMQKHLPQNDFEGHSQGVTYDENPQAEHEYSQNFPTSNRTGSKPLSGSWADHRRKIKKVTCTAKREGRHPRKHEQGSTGLGTRESSGCNFKSNRRPVTSEEKDRAWLLANEMKPANPFFTVVMRNTHVYRGHFMAIAADFVAEHRLLSWETTDLRIPSLDDVWNDVRLFLRKASSFGLTGAQWRNFVEDNNLEEGDACVFELCDAKKKLVFDVHIFRVVNEVTPLTRGQ